jgi:phosphocarrier protein FPr
VLVLMDVGSAVLSAELALDMLAPERAARVRLTAAPLVEGLLAAAVQAAAGGDLDLVEHAALDGLSSKRAHLHDDVLGGHGADHTGHTDELRVRVELPHGLHARPAARIVSALSKFDATVTVTNCTNHRGPVTATSLHAIMGLGVGRGHDVLFRASGRQAAEAVAALHDLARAAFGDAHALAGTNGTATAAHGDGHVPRTTTIDGGDMELTGLAGSPGVGFGAVRWMDETPGRPPADDARGEDAVPRLRAALAAVDETLRLTAHAAPDDHVAEIIETQRMLLSDPTLLAAAEQRVATLGEGAATAWLGAVRQASDSLRDSGDDYLIARIADLDAIGGAVVAELSGTAWAHEDLSGVIATTDISPAQAARLDPALVRAVVTVEGSPSAHSAIVLRSLGIPAVVGVGGRLADLASGTTVIVDGGTGRVIVEPRDALVRAAVAARERREHMRAEQLSRAAEPATTIDGERIAVRANVGSIADAAAAHTNGAEGAGLVRTELLFLDRAAAPSDDEQAEHYARICAALPGQPVVVRTLDVGGDKEVAYLTAAAEANPYLGRRGIRLALAHPTVLTSQLRALLRTAVHHDVRIMLPMVTVPDEIAAVRRLLDGEREALRAAGMAVPAHVQLGVMVETPALALRIASVLPNVDFVSIGTNDLVQYTTAAERGNSAVDHLYDAVDPSVLRLVAEVTERADEAHVPVSLCGAAAEDPLALVVLLGLGIRDVSVPPSLVPEIKERIRSIDIAQARELARRALAAPSGDAVRQVVDRALSTERRSR